MQETDPRRSARRSLGAAALDFAAQTFAAFETLAERRYAAPWQAPAPCATREC